MATTAPRGLWRAPRGLIQRIALAFVALVLGLGDLSFTAPHTAAATSAAYRVSVQVSDHQIWLTPPNAYLEGAYPSSSELIVRVWNGQGRPADGVPVVFEVEPDWTEDASVSVRQSATRNGVARAVFRAEQTGVVRVTVRAGATHKTVAIAVSSPASPSATD